MRAKRKPKLEPELETEPRIVELLLPFPPFSLNPMLRKFWAEREAEAKRYKSDVIFLVNQQALPPFKCPVFTEWEWLVGCRNQAEFNHRDGDNIASAGHKLILDAVVQAGLIPDDSLQWIKSPVLDWFDFKHCSDATGEVLLRISTVPLYKGQFIRLE